MSNVLYEIKKLVSQAQNQVNNVMITPETTLLRMTIETINAKVCNELHRLEKIENEREIISNHRTVVETEAALDEVKDDNAA